MPNEQEVLEQTLTAIAAAPESASALTLFALVSTLEYPQAGCPFRLAKLSDLEPAHRPLAYGLMDLLVAGVVGSPRWQAAKQRMDALVRGESD